MAMYLEAVTIPGPEGDFDPKFKQKKVYRWYDARYSDEALDIYSTEWRDRIVSWHEHAAPLPAAELSVEQLLEQLEFGSFFLAHPIAAFSLWQVLQTCYELDRAVCGVTDEVVSWQKIPPFQYFRDSRIQARWRESLKQLKERIRKRDPSPSGESAEYKMYEIRLGVEKFESAFEALKENFSINLRDMKFALWMIDRIDNDIGKRFAMITDILDFKDEDHIRPIDSSDGDNSGTHQSHSPQEGLKQINKKSEQRQTACKCNGSFRSQFQDLNVF
ncbi:hypothetical protein F5884DRAFT_439164 [Xylogone sp. PMI_703]|nr:hypothetical protein F5884DRAFT_439164 [Xylogone sp. PMI_703]